MIARNCDWFIAFFVPVVIGRSNCFGFGFSTVENRPKPDFTDILPFENHLKDPDHESKLFFKIALRDERLGDLNNTK